jgi:hypothetical protein
MATNRRKIREQVQLLYGQFLDKNGFNDNIDIRLIDLHVEQSINKLLKVQVMQNLKNGSVEIPACSLITYNLTVTSNRVVLPAIPIDLPLGMGVWNVILPSGKYAVPIPKGFISLLGDTIASGLEGQTGYVATRNEIAFKSAVTGQVSVEVLVSDFATTGESEILPLSPDLELEVITMVLGIISEGKFSQLELNAKTQKFNEN